MNPEEKSRRLDFSLSCHFIRNLNTFFLKEIYDSLTWLYTRSRNSLLRLLPQNRTLIPDLFTETNFHRCLELYVHTNFNLSVISKLHLPICPLDTILWIFNKCHYLITVSWPALSEFSSLAVIWGIASHLAVQTRNSWVAALISHLISFPTSTPAAVENAYQTLKFNFPYVNTYHRRVYHYLLPRFPNLFFQLYF